MHCFDYIYRCCTIGRCLGIDSLSCSLQSRCIQRVHDREAKQFLKEHLRFYEFFLNLHVCLFDREAKLFLQEHLMLYVCRL